jgi:nicotinamide N-methyltransferase
LPLNEDATDHDEGYLWGAPTEDLTKHAPGYNGFDVLILADLLFNHSEHAKLIKTVQLTLRKSSDSRAYVFFTPYRPWLLEKDLAFFDLARQAGFAVSKTFEKIMDKVMFEEDPGVSVQPSDNCSHTDSAKDEQLRRTVFGYELSWP